MKQTKSNDNLKQILSISGQLGSFVASVVILIQMFTGTLDSRFAQTLATTSVLLLTGLLWYWRWPRIVQVKPNSRSKKSPGLLQPFQTGTQSTYTLSLSQRRVEGVLLTGITVFALSFAAARTPKIFEEITGIQCKYATAENAPVLVIAEFNNLTAAKSAFADRLFTEMEMQLSNDISVCRSQQIVHNGLEAQDLGSQLNKSQSATVIIWGDNDDRSSEVHITPIQWTAFELQLKADTADSKEIEDWTRQYLPEIIRAEIQFIEGKGDRAIKIFQQALDNLQAESWSADNRESIANLYVLLGLFNEDGSQNQQAIDAYTQALSYNKDLDIARLHRGILYMNGNPEKALEDFNELIQQKSELAADAYANRANIQTEWENVRQDYWNAIALDPENAYYYHFLGLAALENEDTDTAMKAYQASLPHLDAETRDNFIDDLTTEMEDYPLLQSDIEKIIQMLKDAPL